MSDTPKKPRAKKKAASGAQAAPDTGSYGKLNDQTLKAGVLAAALPHAAFDGFTQKVLEEAGKEAGLEKTEIKRLFPEGPLSLLEFYSHHADDEMEVRLKALDLSRLKIRARIAAAVTARLQVLKPNKEAARRAAALLSLPMHAALAAKLMYRTVDAMWRAAGDTSTDFNFYTKRGILAGVYGSTLMRWFNDTSEGETATTEFLAARIENVMQFETLKAQMKTGFDRFAQVFAQGRKT